MTNATEKYRVTYGKHDIVLNPNMVKTDKQLEELKIVYIDLFKIFEKMENTNNPIKLYWLNKEIEPLEFKMQELFGFPVNSDYHRYWCECPKCSCPKLDNFDERGSGSRYIDISCIIHGEKTKQLLQRKEKLERLEYLTAWRDGDLIELDGKTFRLTSDGYDSGDLIVCDSENGAIKYVDLIERAKLIETKSGRKNK